MGDIIFLEPARNYSSSKRTKSVSRSYRRDSNAPILIRFDGSDLENASKRLQRLSKGVIKGKKRSVYFDSIMRRLARWARDYGASLAPERDETGWSQAQKQAAREGPSGHAPGHLRKPSAWSAKTAPGELVVGPRLTKIKKGTPLSGSKAAKISGYYSQYPEGGYAGPAGPTGDYPPYGFVAAVREKLPVVATRLLTDALENVLQDEFDHLGDRP